MQVCEVCGGDTAAGKVAYDTAHGGFSCKICENCYDSISKGKEIEFPTKGLTTKQNSDIEQNARLRLASNKDNLWLSVKVGFVSLFGAFAIAAASILIVIALQWTEVQMGAWLPGLLYFIFVSSAITAHAEKRYGFSIPVGFNISFIVMLLSMLLSIFPGVIALGIAIVILPSTQREIAFGIGAGVGMLFRLLFHGWAASKIIYDHYKQTKAVGRGQA